MGGCCAGGCEVCGLLIESECRETANGVDIDELHCWGRGSAAG